MCFGWGGRPSEILIICKYDYSEKWSEIVEQPVTLLNCILLLYIRTLPSHQYNLECCKKSWTKIKPIVKFWICVVTKPKPKLFPNHEAEAEAEALSFWNHKAEAEVEAASYPCLALTWLFHHPGPEPLVYLQINAWKMACWYQKGGWYRTPHQVYASKFQIPMSISDQCHDFDRHWSALGIDRGSYCFN